MKTFAFVVLATCLSVALAAADSYPVTGRWGQDTSGAKAPIDCTGKHIIDFQGERRFDSNGGVPDYRAIRVERLGQTEFNITEEFRTGQINGRNRINLRRPDNDHVEINMRGGTLKLRPCK